MDTVADCVAEIIAVAEYTIVAGCAFGTQAIVVRFIAGLARNTWWTRITGRDTYAEFVAEIIAVAKFSIIAGYARITLANIEILIALQARVLRARIALMPVAVACPIAGISAVAEYSVITWRPFRKCISRGVAVALGPIGVATRIRTAFRAGAGAVFVRPDAGTGLSCFVDNTGTSFVTLQIFILCGPQGVAVVLLSIGVAARIQAAERTRTTAVFNRSTGAEGLFQVIIPDADLSFGAGVLIIAS